MSVLQTRLGGVEAADGDRDQKTFCNCWSAIAKSLRFRGNGLASVIVVESINNNSMRRMVWALWVSTALLISRTGRQLTLKLRLS